jgi:hypothetical protein
VRVSAVTVAPHPLGAAARQRRLGGGSRSSVAGAPTKTERQADTA